MILQVVADIHGAHEKLRRRIDPDLPLVVLGDSLNLLDFRTFDGVLLKVLGKRKLAGILMTFTTRGKKAAIERADRLFFQNEDAVRRTREIVEEEYSKLAEVLPERAWVIHGNVDYPDLLVQAVGETRYVRGGNREIGGRRVAFVAGTPSYHFAMNLPGELSDERFRANLSAIEPCEVLLSHYTPRIEDVMYDTVARKPWGGSRRLVGFCREHEVALHLFGHVHNPRRRIVEHGPTRFVNVGGFRYNGRVGLLDTETLEFRFKSGE